MSYFEEVKLQGYNGTSWEDVLSHEGLLGIVESGHLIAEGLMTNHTPFFKIGYNPNITTTEEDIWSAGGTYVFPTAEMQMEAVSGSATDAGTVIKGDATGDTVSADADSTLTLLEDDDVDFTAVTAVEVGDCVIIDPHGTDPAFGYITVVAQHTLTIGAGISNGKTMASKPYAVIDRSASTGAQVVGFTYLDDTYVQHGEFVVLNGTTPVNTVNTDIFRVNSFTVVATGTECKAVGDLGISDTAGAVEYSHITAGYTTSRQLVFTVPAGYTGYITSCMISASSYNDSKTQTARVILRTDGNPDLDFLTGCIMYPKAEIVVTNETVVSNFSIPIKIIEKSDFLVSGQGFTGYDGPITAVFRGYLVAN